MIKEASKAQIALSKHITATPLILSNVYCAQFGRKVYLKCECFQRTGSFKFRGVLSRLLQLSAEEKKRGVVMPCLGNHAQAGALAAQILNLKFTPVMPKQSSMRKITYVEKHGSTPIFHGNTFEDAALFAAKTAQQEGAILLHPYEDEAMIAGVGTVALEILEQNPDTEAILVPVGGGALLGAIASVIKEKKSKAAIIGVQPQNGSVFYTAYHSHNTSATSDTASPIADALNISQIQTKPYALVEKYVDDFWVVSEESIIAAIASMLEQSHIVVEGAAAVSLAALLENLLPAKHRNVTLILTGGNMESPLLSKIIHHGLTKDQRVIRLDILTPDQPGKLQEIATILHDQGANIIQVYQNRFLAEQDFFITRVQMIVETKGPQHAKEIITVLTQNGFQVESPEKPM